MKKLKGCMTVILGLFVLGAVGSALGLGGKNETSQAPVENSYNAATTSSEQDIETTTEQTTEQTYGIGQVVTVGDVEYTVNSTSQAATVGNEYLGETAQGVYLLVNVTVKNNGKEALSVSDSFFKLYKDDIEYESDSAAALYANDDSSFFLEKVNLGNAVTSHVVFDVPQDVANASGIQLQVQTGFWGTKTAKINLQ